MRRGESTTTGHITIDVGNPFFFEVARSIEDYAESKGLNVLISNSNGSAERQTRYLELFQAQRARGILISPAGDIMEQTRKIVRQGTPVVLIDQQADPSVCSSVIVNDEAGGHMAAACSKSVGVSSCLSGASHP